MMNFVVTMVVIMVVGLPTGLILANCNCKLIVGNEVVVKAFFPWTFNKKVKEYQEAKKAQREAERIASEEKRQQIAEYNKKKKLAVLRTIEEGSDNEQNKIIKSCNSLINEYLERGEIDKEYFIWLQGITISGCYNQLNRLILARQNHEKVMEFHCC